MKRPPKPRSRAAFATLAMLPLASFISSACSTQLERVVVRPELASTLDRDSEYLKAHMRDGRVYVLSAWQVDTLGRSVTGQGELLDQNRARITADEFTLPLDSVALFETNVVQTHPSVAALAVITGISAGLTVFCATNTKACFGSCPTFYASDGADGRIEAEGFSSSIAPSLEKRDVDALYRSPPASREFTLHMRNEALETHVVRSVALLYAPKPAGGRIVATDDGRFREAHDLTRPTSCADAQASGGDCTRLIRAFDDEEYWTPVDSTDLAARSELEIAFDSAPAGETGLVIASRQSLVPTFLLYQALAYLGRDATRWLAAIERGVAGSLAVADGIERVLGGIEVLVEDEEGEWILAGEVLETGPLAPDVKLVPLPTGTRRMRLRMARGGWRIDYIALASLGAEVSPIRLEPAAVSRNGEPAPRARALLSDPARSLVTLPGDEYQILFRLPPAPERYELFLESRGYYLEWMRDEWIAEEDRARAARLFLDPAGALRELAPTFARIETDAERSFWSSRYVSH